MKNENLFKLDDEDFSKTVDKMSKQEIDSALHYAYGFINEIQKHL